MAFSDGFGRINDPVYTMTVRDQHDVFSREVTEDMFNRIMRHLSECDEHPEFLWAILASESGNMVQMWRQTDNGFIQMQINCPI